MCFTFVVMGGLKISDFVPRYFIAYFWMDTSYLLRTGASSFFQEFTKGKPVLAALKFVGLSGYVSRKSM